MVLWKWIKFVAHVNMALRLRILGLTLIRWNVRLMAVVVAIYGEPLVVDGQRFNFYIHTSLYFLCGNQPTRLTVSPL